MPTNRKLREALLKKLGVTPQALWLRVQRKKAQIPMSTEDATYLIAHEEGIRIDRYLDAGTLHRVRQLTTHALPVAALTKPTRRQPSGENVEKVIRFPNEFKTRDPILEDRYLREAVEMAAIYPLLYVLENSIREVVSRVLMQKYGLNWWDERLTTGKAKTAKQTADSRMKDESRQEWHQRRGARPIDYLDLKDLEVIVRAHEADFFPDILGDKEWFGQFMRELYPSRCVVCHMNPLDKTNIRDVKLKLERWNKQIKGVRAKIV